MNISTLLQSVALLRVGYNFDPYLTFRMQSFFYFTAFVCNYINFTDSFVINSWGV